MNVCMRACVSERARESQCVCACARAQRTCVILVHANKHSIFFFECLFACTSLRVRVCVCVCAYVRAKFRALRTNPFLLPPKLTGRERERVEERKTERPRPRQH